MTALETLQKYGLKTDVKSIRERMLKNDYFSIVYGSDVTTDRHVSSVKKEADNLHTADLSLLCSLAEKGERWEMAVKKSKSELKSLISAIYDYDNGRKRYWDSTIAKERIKTLDEIITEAEGETK